MYSCLKSYGIDGIDAFPVTVEATFGRAMPGFDIVGLPDAAIKESRLRVQSSIRLCGYELPAGSRMYEAVEKAGGMTSEAAQEYVNLAQAIEDGQQLRIPSREAIRKYQETGKDVSGLLGAGGADGNGSE